MRGKISEISIPETLVLIGLNGPRMEAGASGFMSQVSNWLGPPTNIKWIQFTSLLGCTAPIALRRKKCGIVSPRKPSDPACRKSRRLTPSQKCAGLSASSRNIGISPSRGNGGKHRPLLHKTWLTPYEGTSRTILFCLYQMELVFVPLNGVFTACRMVKRAP